MSKYLYKEKSYAEDVIKNGFTSKYIATELNLAARYKKEHNEDEGQIKEFLYEFCKNNLKGFNEVLHFKMINKAVSYAMNDKNKLIEIEGLKIKINEIEYIENLDIEYDLKKIVFTLLVLNRLYKTYAEIKNVDASNKEFFFGGYKNFIELSKLSKVTFKKTKFSQFKNIHDAINILDKKDIVRIVGNGKIKLLFMYELEEAKESVDIAIEVKDFSQIGLYFGLINDEKNIKQCECCDVPIKVSNNKMMFCKPCSTERWRKYNAKKQREYRKRV